MTIAELVEAMRALPEDDTERAHGGADRLLLDFLDSNGLYEVAQAWRDARDLHDGFWYS